MKPGAKKIFVTATLFSVGIFLMANWLCSGLSVGRFDLTDGKIYTISPASKKILKALDAPVSVKFYVSSADKMPTEYKSLEQDVVGKLDEIRVASGGKLSYKIFHMDASNVTAQSQKKEGEAESLEKQLQQKGINPFQVRAIDSDEVAVKLIYSAISIGFKEKPEEIVPRVIPDTVNQLEYTLVSKIYRMTLDKTLKIAMVAPYNEKKTDPQLKALLAQMGGELPEAYREDNYEVLPMALKYEGYEVSRIKLDEKEPIPADATTLVVVEPTELNDRQRYEINRFLASGGDVFISVQNYEYDYQPRNGDLSISPRPKKPEINSLLQSWGLEVDEQILVDEQQDVIQLSGAAMMGPFEMTIPVKVPIQVLVPASGMNPGMSITSRLSSIFYLWGTALKLNNEKIKSQNLKVENLLQSSTASWTVPFREGQIGPSELMRQPESRNGPFPLAVMVSGQFADAYKDQPVPAWPKPEEKKPQDPNQPAPPETTPKNVEPEKPTPIKPAPGKLVLIGASTLFQKNLIRGGGNLGFFMNSIDAVSLGDDIVTIRSKQPVERNLGRISQAAKLGWRVFVIFFIPVLLAVLGTLRMILRRQSKQNYLKTYEEATA